MFKSGLTIIFILVCILISAQEQDDIPVATNDFSFGLGLSNLQLKENTLNTIRHKNTGVYLELNYLRQKAHLFHRLRLDITFSMLKSRYENEAKSLAIHTYLHYVIGTDVIRSNHKFDLLVGGLAGFNYNIFFFEYWDDSHYYWMSAFELGASAKTGYYFNNNSLLSAELGLPVIALVSRPPERILYKLDDPDFKDVISKTTGSSKVTSVHEYFSINFNVDYIFQANDRLRMALLLRTHYTRANLDDSQKLNMLRYAFGLGFIF